MRSPANCPKQSVGDVSLQNNLHTYSQRPFQSPTKLWLRKHTEP